MNPIQRIVALTRRIWNGPQQPVRTVLLGQVTMGDAEIREALRLDGPVPRAVHALLDQAILDATADALNVDAQTTPIVLAHAQGRAAALCEFKSMLAERCAVAQGGAKS